MKFNELHYFSFLFLFISVVMLMGAIFTKPDPKTKKSKAPLFIGLSVIFLFISMAVFKFASLDPSSK